MDEMDGHVVNKSFLAEHKAAFMITAAVLRLRPH